MLNFYLFIILLVVMVPSALFLFNYLWKKKNGTDKVNGTYAFFVFWVFCALSTVLCVKVPRIFIVTDDQGGYENNVLLVPTTLSLGNQQTLHVSPQWFKKQYKQHIVVNNSNIDVIYEEVAYGNANAANEPTRINSYDSLELHTNVVDLFTDPPRSMKTDKSVLGAIRGWVHYADDN
jgi:heme/copper-type cytochrome/quinol oxidase subunit 2